MPVLFFSGKQKEDDLAKRRVEIVTLHQACAKYKSQAIVAPLQRLSAAAVTRFPTTPSPLDAVCLRCDKAKDLQSSTSSRWLWKHLMKSSTQLWRRKTARLRIWRRFGRERSSRRRETPTDREAKSRRTRAHQAELRRHDEKNGRDRSATTGNAKSTKHTWSACAWSTSDLLCRGAKEPASQMPLDLKPNRFIYLSKNKQFHTISTSKLLAFSFSLGKEIVLNPSCCNYYIVISYLPNVLYVL